MIVEDGTSAHQLELTWLRDRKEPYDLGDDEFHLAFRVDDFDAAHKLHEEMGCICFENPDMGIYFCEDPDHYWLEVLPCRNQGKDSRASGEPATSDSKLNRLYGTSSRGGGVLFFLFSYRAISFRKCRIGFQNNTDNIRFGSFKIPNRLDFVLKRAILSSKNNNRRRLCLKS